MGSGTVVVLRACGYTSIARHRATDGLPTPFFRIAGNDLYVHPRPPPPSISWIVRARKHENGQLTGVFKDDNCQQQPAEDSALFGGGGGGNSGIISACFVGLLTGLSVVLFNNVVHEIRDLCWDGIPSRGALWLRELPHEKTWERIILIPTCGGLVVSLVNIFRSALDEENSADSSSLKAVLKPILKAVAAAVTLGTGNSLGPEGPSVEIGASVAKGVGSMFDKDAPQRKLSLKAAGSAAGISSEEKKNGVTILSTPPPSTPSTPIFRIDGSNDEMSCSQASLFFLGLGDSFSSHRVLLSHPNSL